MEGDQESNLCSVCELPNERPEIPRRGVYLTRLKQGEEILWCACGRSTEEPFCDGESCGRFKPVRYTPTRQQSVYSLCGCKYTKKPPFCDASHIDIGKSVSYPPCACQRPSLSW